MEDKLYFGENLDLDMQFKIFKTGDCIEQQHPHTHDYIQIWYLKQGECVHSMAGQHYTLSAGNFMIIQVGVEHRIIEISDNAELICIEFAESFIKANINNISIDYLFDWYNIDTLFSLEGTVLKLVESLLEELYFEFTQKQEWYQFFVKANLLKILAIILREYDKKTTPAEEKYLVKRYQTSILEVLEYIKQNYNTKLYLEDVSRRAMMSPSYFSYVFKCIVGKTFTEYVKFLRIERSKELLKNDEKTICGISLEVGFSDTSAFDRAFKKEMGMSPIQYRKNL